MKAMTKNRLQGENEHQHVALFVSKGNKETRNIPHENEDDD